MTGQQVALALPDLRSGCGSTASPVHEGIQRLMHVRGSPEMPLLELVDSDDESRGFQLVHGAFRPPVVQAQLLLPGQGIHHRLPSQKIEGFPHGSILPGTHP